MIRTLTIVTASLLLAAPAIAQVAPPAPKELTPGDIDKLPRSKPLLVDRYGSEPMQFGELRLPAGDGPHPVAIVIHGGCFLRAYESVDGTAPIADALTKRGIATWNVEYRALGDEGAGWPGTYRDWGAAADHLHVLAKRHPLDLKRVVAIGHSAGAPAAVYLATRGRLDAKAETRGGDPVKVAAVVAVDGPPDLSNLVGADEQICGAPVISRLIGGTPATHAARVAEVSPVAHLPLGVPTLMVSSSPVLPMPVAAGYRDAAVAKGDVAEILAVKGDHFNIIAPGQPQWNEVEKFIVDRAFGGLTR